MEKLTGNRISPARIDIGNTYNFNQMERAVRLRVTAAIIAAFAKSCELGVNIFTAVYSLTLLFFLRDMVQHFDLSQKKTAGIPTAYLMISQLSSRPPFRSPQNAPRRISPGMKMKKSIRLSAVLELT
jgi:hypothetical protein